MKAETKNTHCTIPFIENSRKNQPGKKSQGGEGEEEQEQ